MQWIGFLIRRENLFLIIGIQLSYPQDDLLVIKGDTIYCQIIETGFRCLLLCFLVSSHSPNKRAPARLTETELATGPRPNY